MIISMIAGIGKNRQLGLFNKMVWHVPADFKHFKKTTMNHHMVMGRKTFESIGKPLPGRKTIILTRNKEYRFDHPDVIICHSVENVLTTAKSNGEGELFVCGGEEIYKLFYSLAEKLILSHIDYDGEADAFFPDYSEFVSKRKEKKEGFFLEVLTRSRK